MRSLAIAAGLFVAAIGILLMATPSGFIAIAQPVVTPAGLYVAAAVRVALGAILLRASRISRAPAALRTIGAVAVLAGLATPVVGVDRSIVVLDWWASRGPEVMRATGAAAVGLGGFIVYSVTARK